MKLPYTFLRALLAVPLAAAVVVAAAGPAAARPVIPGGGGDIPKLSFNNCYVVTVYTPNPNDPAVEVCPPTG